MQRIKIILVDDELTSRNTIKNYLEDNDTYEVVADFVNGKTALEWLRTNKIDIVLCDMQMPEINGVELMRSIHIIDEYLPVIAISGYDDFNYVRGSLINGAENYLLKHELSKERLLAVLDQVREKYRIVPVGDSTYRKNSYCTFDENEFSADRIRELSRTGEIAFSCQNVVPIAISPDYKLRTDLHLTEYKRDICKAIIDMLGQILQNKYQYVICITRRNHLILLLSFTEERSMLSMINLQTNLIGRLQRQIVRMLDITVTIVSGEIHWNIGDAIAEGIGMESLLADKLYLGGNKVMNYAVTKGITYYKGELPEGPWKQFTFELDHCMDTCGDTLYEILDVMEKQRYAWENVYRSCKRVAEILAQKGIVSDDDLHDLLTEMKEYEEYEQFRSAILEMLHRYIQAARMERRRQYSEQINQVIEYVRRNLAEDISLEKCAELAGCSYTYLSREFKKETGMRFVEFLNHERVNRAKSLLIRKDLSMKQIVDLSGFRNYNYFFKVFKEMEGMTPSEFVS